LILHYFLRGSDGIALGNSAKQIYWHDLALPLGRRLKAVRIRILASEWARFLVSDRV
jgi:hypothetical protein